MTEITDYTDVTWSPPFMVSIVQKLLMKLFLKTTLRSLTEAPTLYGNRKIKSGRT